MYQVLAGGLKFIRLVVWQMVTIGNVTFGGNLTFVTSWHTQYELVDMWKGMYAYLSQTGLGGGSDIKRFVKCFWDPVVCGMKVGF